MPTKEFRLRNKLKGLKGYDVVIFDCAPTFGTLPMNVFTTAKEIIIPIQLGHFSLEGVNTFIDTVNFINRTMGPLIDHYVAILGLLINFYDTRAKLAREILAAVHDAFQEKVFSTTIPQNIKLNEANPRANQSLILTQNAKAQRLTSISHMK